MSIILINSYIRLSLSYVMSTQPDSNNVRQWGQILIAFILVGAMVGYLGYYTLTQSDDSFKLALAEDMRVLIIMGIGAALAIFGLGRTVGKK